MHALSASVVLEFCKICSWAYEVWLNHRELFDHNPRATELQKSRAGDELARLSVISQEYALLQIVKLHDRAVMNDNVTLGIDYIVTYGGWSDSIRAHLGGLANEMKALVSKLRGARNKSLSHNDLATIVAGATLGAFAQGADDRYFEVLQEFVNTVHEQVIGGPWPFDDIVKNDVAAFLATVKP